jgi:hypothetical protein
MRWGLARVCGDPSGICCRFTRTRALASFAHGHAANFLSVEKNAGIHRANRCTLANCSTHVTVTLP